MRKIVKYCGSNVLAIIALVISLYSAYETSNAQERAFKYKKEEEKINSVVKTIDSIH
ncbi:hypothetical protein [Piscirickettsia salmonis]|uniref:hypothetical protein n=1 Tax=Piscirickettsia salmonis TaxID=1238 RepID=UPI0012FEECED